MDLFIHNPDGTLVTPILDQAAEPERSVTYTPCTDGYAVGYRIERGDGAVSYLYLNPSNRDGEPDAGEPAVFVYTGEHGNPAQDVSEGWYSPDFGGDRS